MQAFTNAHEKRSPTVIGAGCKLTGDIKTDHTVQIHGEVLGSIVAETVVIGRGGRVVGKITATNLFLHGSLDGPAVTMRMTAAGLTPQKTHLGMNAIASAEKGNVIVIDNGGRMDSSCWGGILANAAKTKGVAGTVIDGCCRDLDDCIEADYTVYARGTVVCTARGRVIEESTNQMVQFGGVQVRPGDVVMGDSSGIVIVPQEAVDAVLAKAEELWQKEEDMIAEIRAGADILEVDAKYNYNKMLQK